MTIEAPAELRALLGEDIPSGGGEGETLFTNEEIESYIAKNDGDIERAAYEGWRVKAARLSNLVDTTEGNSQKKFSQLLTAAERMVKMYARSSSGATEGRTRVGRSVRPAVDW